MAQPNAQNSELDPQKHPSGARIETIVSNAEAETSKSKKEAADKGMYGETLRPSERDDDEFLVPPTAAPPTTDSHRRTPSTRET